MSVIKKPFGRMFKPDEHSHQVALFEWAGLNIGKYPELRWLHAVPNGGRRDAITAANLKREGVRAGVPDVFLDVPRGGHHGFRGELKRPAAVGKARGTPTDAQIEWGLHYQQNGYCFRVCWGWEDMRDAIIDYLDGKLR